MEIKIIIASHKEYPMPTEDIYLPVQVGAAGKEAIGYVRDDSGVNISEKNPFYCELTGLYWAWKNVDADYLGLVHYRRHFKGASSSKNKFQNIISKGEVEALLQEHDIIVPKKRKYYIESLYSHYANTHYAEHLELVKEIIQKKYPEYNASCEMVFKRTYGYMFNMMIMKKKYCDAYCEWLFDILSELEKKVDMTTLSDFQKRLYGRVSEILFNVWLDYQLKSGFIRKQDIQEVAHMHMEQINWLKKCCSFLKAKFFKNKYEKSF